MHAFTRCIVELNRISDWLGQWLLAPIAWLPDWISTTVVGFVTGMLMLLAYQYTSNQAAIKRVRNNMKANLLALKLFKDSAPVVIMSQFRLCWDAFRLLQFSLVPTLCMLIPFSLATAQLALWFQARPLHAGEEAVVTLALSSETTDWPDVSFNSSPGAEVVMGPVRIVSRREVCWRVKAGQGGYHQLPIRVGNAELPKELAVGDGLMRVSIRRPSWAWSDVLRHPAETPFPADSAVDSVSIAYPNRTGWISGTNYWIVYWLLSSMVTAVLLRSTLGVSL